MRKNAIVPGKDIDNRKILSVLTMARYFVSPSGACESMDTQNAEIQCECEYYENIAYDGRIKPSLVKRDVDLYPWRARTDFVVQGIARSEKECTQLKIVLSCEGKRKKFGRTILATGDRRVEKTGGRLELTSPEPFTEMPVRYDKAYGGTDEKAESKYAAPGEIDFFKLVCGEEEDSEQSEYSYPRNPAGKGYLIDMEGVDGLHWPNLEFPDERLRLDRLAMPLDHWGERIYPACFDWFPQAWFPRVAFFGGFLPTYDGQSPKKEVDMGLMEPDLPEKSILRRTNIRFSQCAHPYMWRHRLSGDEHIRIGHMTSDGRGFEVRLPGQRPKMELCFSGSERKLLEPCLDLVFIETEKNAVSLLWRGSSPIDETTITPDLLDRTEYRISY